MYATLVTLVITISPLVLVIFCKLWVVKVSSTEPDILAPTVVANIPAKINYSSRKQDIPAKTNIRAHHQLLQVISGEFLNYQSSIEHRSDLSSLQIRPVF